MNKPRWTALALPLMALAMLTGCETATATTDATAASANTADAPQASPHDRPGFRTFEADGRLWVFRESSKALTDYQQGSEPGKFVIWVNAGPSGHTLRSPDADTLLEYLAVKPGFTTVADGRSLWVFKQDSSELEQFMQDGKPAKFVTWIAQGPRDSHLLAVTQDTLVAYTAARPGFATYADGNILWVFREGSQAHQDYQANGAPGKSVTRLAAGPRGMHLRAADRDTLEAYVAAGD